MNIRLQKYKANRLAGMNQYNAARAAGYSESTARGKMAKIERSAKVGLKDAFEQAGLTDKRLVEIGLEGLEATKLFGKDGIEHKDWSSVHKFYETVLELTDYISKKPLIEQHTHYHLADKLKEARSRIPNATSTT